MSYEGGITEQSFGGVTRFMQSRRLNRDNQFMHVLWHSDPAMAVLWTLIDISGPSAEILDAGRGRPPAHHLPPGVEFSAKIPA